MYDIGYTTGTFDLLHEGHYEILKKCKLYCKKLIVGLVTDSLGAVQKRKPILSYSHRKLLLENSAYVDSVVEFNGTTKEQDYKKLKFNILFIADEYQYAHEYERFEQWYPAIPVIYIPRTTDVSTSAIYKTILSKVLNDVSVRASGISGDVLSLNWKKDKNLIIKPVKVSYSEYKNTANNYKISMPPPRNWKMLNHTSENHPMISGINPMREIKIFEFLKHKKWYPVTLIEEKMKPNKQTTVNEKDAIQTMLKERNLGKLYWVVQTDGGKTLREYVKYESLEKRIALYKQVKDIIEEMREMNILHMDLHPENILVDSEEQLSIIDFGWCMHKSFDMDIDEKTYYKTCFTENFDLKHFIESLVYTGLERNIPKIK